MMLQRYNGWLLPQLQWLMLQWLRTPVNHWKRWPKGVSARKKKRPINTLLLKGGMRNKREWSDFSTNLAIGVFVYYHVYLVSVYHPPLRDSKKSGVPIFIYIYNVPLRDVGDVKSRGWRKLKRDTQVTVTAYYVGGNMEHGLPYRSKEIIKSWYYY